MVRFTVHNLGEHTIEDMIITGPFKQIIMPMVEMFLASYTGPPEGDLDYAFVEYFINFSQGQGQILEYRQPPQAEIH